MAWRMVQGDGGRVRRRCGKGCPWSRSKRSVEGEGGRLFARKDNGRGGRGRLYWWEGGAGRERGQWGSQEEEAVSEVPGMQSNRGDKRGLSGVGGGRSGGISG